MISINELLNSHINNHISTKGWLVSLDGGFYLIDWDGENNYWESPKILINRNDLYSILKHDGRILFNGGGPSVFHKANIEGTVSIDPASKEKCLNLDKLLLENANKWLQIDLSNHYEKDMFDDLNWNDLFK